MVPSHDGDTANQTLEHHLVERALLAPTCNG